jgi:ribosomal-protein-alanine N-acetyltransferase
MVRGVQSLVKQEEPSKPQDSFIAGYVGVWFQGDEAHITEIAVRQQMRGQGIGELLLIGTVRGAVERGSSVVTLEVRISNFIAQRLYEKYGFRTVGIRKGYYADNHEDASIMTTSPIHSEEYQRMFQNLQQAYRSRWREIWVSA